MWERGLINRKPHFTSDLPYVASFACMLPVFMTISVGEIFLIWHPCLHALSNVLPSSLSLALLLDFWQWDAAMSLPSWCLSFSLSNVCGHSLHFCFHWGSLWYFLLLLHFCCCSCEASVSLGGRRNAFHPDLLPMAQICMFWEATSFYLPDVGWDVQKASISFGILPNSPYCVDHCQM